MAEKEMNKINYLDTASTAGFKKAGEGVGSALIDASTKFVGKQYEQYKVRTGAAFKKYLDNAYERINQMKTLATGLDIVPVVGLNSIYVNMAVRYTNRRAKQSKEIEVITAEDLLDINNNIIIVGTGGAGKTMMLKYLFLNTRNRGSYIPVFLELRKLSGQKPDRISMEQLIYNCMQDYNVDLPLDYLEYSFKQNRYLFLMDGLDEVDEAVYHETANAIQQFCARYPQNGCIVTSRKRESDHFLLETFTHVESLPLDIEKALCLAKKLGGDEEKNREFCRELQEDLFIRHNTFAENPLLLTMMFLVYMRNGSIPDHLVDFYSKCYDVLYSVHDTHHKGSYKRHFKCKELSEQEFKRIFASFCFKSYVKKCYEFRKEELISYLEPCIARGTDKAIAAEDYLTDLQDAVCLMVKEGDVYRFVHRSFQTFFAAVHTDGLKDDQQQLLMKVLLGGTEVSTEWDYYMLLHQIQPERFYANAMEPTIRELLNRVNEAENPDKELLQSIYIFYLVDTEWPEHTNFGRFHYQRNENRYSGVLSLYGELFACDMDLRNLYGWTTSFDSLLGEMSAYIASMPKICHDVIDYGKLRPERWISDQELDEYAQQNPEDTYFQSLLDRYYAEIISVLNPARLRGLLEEWLLRQEQKRRRVEAADDFDSLVDSLI